MQPSHLAVFIHYQDAGGRDDFEEFKNVLTVLFCHILIIKMSWGRNQV
jgi:hypothetical protein